MAVNIHARGEWTKLVHGRSEGVLIVQSLRNLIIGVTILVASASAIFAAIVSMLVNAGAIEQLQYYASSDPISEGNSFASTQLKLLLALASLIISIILLVQSVRLSIHLGFLLQTATSDEVDSNGDGTISKNRMAHLMSQHASNMMGRASFYFSTGLRFFFLFFPPFMWAFGALPLLLTTVIEIAMLVAMDVLPCEDEHSYKGSVNDNVDDAV